MQLRLHDVPDELTNQEIRAHVRKILGDWCICHFSLGRPYTPRPEPGGGRHRRVACMSALTRRPERIAVPGARWKRHRDAL